ncbi:MerR family transcriptional regulator [Enterococcus thailandicus]|uniref:MerR family transcriptional regulator n=1 Tax=Enterococcus thailandicus TaxID=417368 RepID=UPI0022EC11D9|nr:MerR family transcriptional regulator [Enterococcus thailandicus]MDA3972759.1 MerR family transcriptional regulator [Enterococcus thailandicus]MDA3975255.1 MerR family transcriptional regulator [Enterococcus thailandicus]MDA3980219.1 MerR family transcriptional regulator [Enterococcus thailandicus]
MEYRIGEFSKLTGFSEHTLRFYEKKGLISPRRNESNLRLYSEEDVIWMEFFSHMKNTGMSIEDLVRYTRLRKEHVEGNLQELMTILVEHRKKVFEQYKMYENNLQLLDKKIAIYQEQLERKHGKDLFESYYEKVTHKKVSD